MIPYISILIFLIIFNKKSDAPKASGKPYFTEDIGWKIVLGLRSMDDFYLTSLLLCKIQRVEPSYYFFFYSKE